jgi:hypothetical protein
MVENIAVGVKCNLRYQQRYHLIIARSGEKNFEYDSNDRGSIGFVIGIDDE